MQIKGFIIDLDSTLIKTELIKGKLFLFMHSCGFDDVEARKIYDESRVRGKENVFTLHHFEEVVRRHIVAGDGSKRFQESEWSAIVSGEAFRGGELVIEGVKEFLESVNKIGIPYFVVTLGVRQYQMDKIGMAGLVDILRGSKKTLDDVVRHTTNEVDGKEEMMKSVMVELGLDSMDGVVFINDKPDETERILKEFPELSAIIRVEKSDRRYSESDYRRLRENGQVLLVSEDLYGVTSLCEGDENSESKVGLPKL